MVKNIIKILATLFGSGYSKVAPGTVGSILSFVILWFAYTGTILNVLLFLGIAVASIWICGFAEDILGKKDDQRIVLDEFVGSFFSIMFLQKKVWLYFVAFVLFRIFDITKPLFIKKAQKLKGGLGIILDDVIAGICATIVIVIFIIIRY